jgi:2-(1,2-epoxy-1,2-dihydrophenyl)acetyl-CoA isomerase
VGDRVTFHVDERHIARVRLAWVEGRNAIDPAMVHQLAEALEGARGPGVRAVLISADGPAFTVGGDLHHLAERRDDLDSALATAVPLFHDVLMALAALEAPVIAAVHGAIAGGGLGIAWCSDLVLAAEGTRFATGFANLGLSGDGGSSWWLPRMVGVRRAKELLIAGRVLDAHEALDWGLITEVVPAGELAARAETVAAELSSGPTFAFGQMRRLLHDSAARTLEQQLAAEGEAMAASAGTPDAVEALNAFLERREPHFSGEAAVAPRRP